MELISNSLHQTLLSLKVVGEAFSFVWFIVLPPIFFYLFKELWMYFIQTKYWLAQDWVLLEITPPKDIEKSPKPMEALFVGMAGAEAAINPVERYIQGKYADSFSLEIVSDGGTMHMYIRTVKRFRHLIEAHLYAQYPDIEVNEVPDYVHDVPRVIPNMQWDLWGSDLEFVKHTAFPIRTYKHFEEDVTGKMIDPLAGLAETICKIGPGQKLWFQIIVSPHSPSWAKEHGRELAEKLKGKEVASENILDRLWTDIKDVLGNIFPAFSAPVEFPKKTKKEEQPLEFRLSATERDILKEVEEKLGKIMFRTKMRVIYLGRREGYDKALGVTSFFGAIKQFNDDNLNSLKPEDASKTYANYIFNKTRLRYRQYKILRRYRNRSSDGVVFTMNTEELATMFHVPDMQVVAPTLTRVDAKRGGAPTNLPME